MRYLILLNLSNWGWGWVGKNAEMKYCRSLIEEGEQVRVHGFIS